jgi:hypothetical protein
MRTIQSRIMHQARDLLLVPIDNAFPDPHVRCVFHFIAHSSRPQSPPAVLWGLGLLDASVGRGAGRASVRPHPLPLRGPVHRRVPAQGRRFPPRCHWAAGACAHVETACWGTGGPLQLPCPCPCTRAPVGSVGCGHGPHVWCRPRDPGILPEVALDPSAPGPAHVALPRDRLVLACLTAHASFPNVLLVDGEDPSVRLWAPLEGEPRDSVTGARGTPRGIHLHVHGCRASPCVEACTPWGG